MVTAVLASPDFLYRSVAPRGGPAGGAYALADAELASRLSFFLWGQGPDDDAARSRGRRQAVATGRPGRRRSDACSRTRVPTVLVDEFALRWLHVHDLDAIQPDKLLFPEFTDALRSDFAEEITLFLRSVLLEDKDVRTLLTANYTFVNERLARHYGSSQHRRPTVPPRHARGSAPLRAARQGRGAAAHVVRRPHVAGAARAVGARQAHGHAADSAAARRRHEPHAAAGRKAEDGPRAAASSTGRAPSASRATA